MVATKKIRIVFVINTLQRGGSERHLLRLVEGLVQSGHWDVSVYCLARTGSFVPAMEALGVEVAGPAEPMSRSPLQFLRGLVGLFQYLRREEPTIAHCYLIVAGLLGSVAARLAGVPHVVTTRRMVYSYAGPKWVLYRMTMGLTRRLSEVVIAVCETARRQGIEEGMSPAKIVTIYNSIACHDDRPTGRGRFAGRPVIGTMGALHERKGHSYLLEAMPRVLAALPEARLVIAGKGPKMGKLAQEVGRLGLREHVELLGEELDVDGFLAELDLFVLPSIWEGLPNVVLEAMLAGLPVIATRVGGVPEVVQDGETGILVEPYSPDELADAILRMWGDAELRRRCAASGRALVVRRYADVEREVAETEAVYWRLLPAPSSVPGAGCEEPAR